MKENENVTVRLPDGMKMEFCGTEEQNVSQSTMC